MFVPLRPQCLTVSGYFLGRDSRQGSSQIDQKKAGYREFFFGQAAGSAAVTPGGGADPGVSWIALAVIIHRWQAFRCQQA